MRYLILTPSGMPVDEPSTLAMAEEAIHRTNNAILFIAEFDGELEEARAINAGERDPFMSNDECEALLGR